MARYTKELLKVLAPAISVARRTLAAMEEDDVPAPLRKVAKYSGKTLPPPLVRPLVDYLDADPEFRELVAEKGADELPEPAAAFLTRPDGWWSALAAAASAETAAAGAARLEEATREVARLERFAAEAKERAEQGRVEAARARTEARERVEAARERVRELAAAETVADRTDASRAATLEAELVDAIAAAAELRVVVEALRQRIRNLRKRPPSDPGGERGSLPAEPVARARALDQLLEMAAQGRSADVRNDAEAGRPHRRAFGLPAGIRPDSKEALAWLMTADPATVIVDGYNVLYRIQESGHPGGAARTRLEAALRRLHRQSTGRHSVIVVYDSALGGDRAAPVKANGLEVRFAPEGLLADEEIAELAASVSGPVVVVSSDREVRETVAATGAVALWSEAIVSLLSGA